MRALNKHSNLEKLKSLKTQKRRTRPWPNNKKVWKRSGTTMKQLESKSLKPGRSATRGKILLGKRSRYMENNLSVYYRVSDQFEITTWKWEVLWKHKFWLCHAMPVKKFCSIKSWTKCWMVVQMKMKGMCSTTFIEPAQTESVVKLLVPKLKMGRLSCALTTVHWLVHRDGVRM